MMPSLPVGKGGQNGAFFAYSKIAAFPNSRDPSIKAALGATFPLQRLR